MLRKIAAMFLVLAGLAAGTACASEAVIRKAVQARFPDIPVDSVSKTPFGGIYEIVVGGRILYTDDKVSYIFIGKLLDTRGVGERDLTAERSAQLAAQTLRKSTDQAIKRVRGNGKRVIYTFEDPNCGFCRQLQRELLKISDITIYTFLWPILSQDSEEKSRAIWCAKDRAKAWDDVMLRGAGAQSDGQCETPIDRNKQLAQRFRINGTPAIFFADGSMNGGYMPAEQLEQALNSIASK
jgi:thiol:disulfide interchange protein DsbC